MGRIISVVNQKGGVGKTTTSVNMAACLAVFNKKVLLVDIDPQANAASGLGVRKDLVEVSVYNILVRDEPAVNIIQKTGIKNLDILPSHADLSGAQVELVNMIAREAKLKNGLAAIRDQYDYIVIDCPPSLGLLTINALVASDALIIPIQCEYYALEGVAQLMQTFNLVKQHLNPNLEIDGVLLTMFDKRINLAQQVVDDIREYFKGKVYNTVIPRNVRLSEAPSFGLPIIFYDIKSPGATSYMEFVEEVIAREKERIG